MWCQHCRQDVPALPSGDQQGLSCPRCGADVCADTPKTDSTLSAYDQWELNEQLRHIEHVLYTPNAAEEGVCLQEPARLDQPHADVSQWHRPVQETPTVQSPQVPIARDEQRTGSPLVWLALSMGVACFACGGVLLGWSLTTGRQELWTVGLPIAMIGQIALLVGLVLQLDRLWHDNRKAAEKLENVDRQISELKTTTTLLGNNQGSSVFYSHFANGAGPRVLLTDLKSQLDLLATKLSQEDR